MPSPAASEAAALISMIERAAADPSVDIDRIERMYAMYERATARSAQSAYLSALAKARAEMPTIVKRGEISTNQKAVDGKPAGKVAQSTFAKWEDVVETILPVMQRHDLVLTFRTEQPGLDRVSVTAVLSHVDGHSERSQMALPIENSGSKNNAQGWGSSVSYGKRYTAFALLNLVGRDEDNDGAGADPETVSEEQAIQLRDWIEATNTNEPAFLEHFGAPSLAAFPAAKFETAIAAFKKKQGARK
jgi:hypothetical protein